MKKILVTGGCGFIGHYLVKELLKDGYEVSVIDNLERGNIGRLEDVKNDIEYYSGDIRRSHDVHEAMGRGAKKNTHSNTLKHTNTNTSGERERESSVVILSFCWLNRACISFVFPTYAALSV